MGKNPRSNKISRLSELRQKQREANRETQHILEENEIKMTEKQKLGFVKKALKYGGKYKGYLILSLLFMLIGNSLDLVIPVQARKRYMAENVAERL